MFEDYSDSYEIAVFGEDYVKLKAFINEGYFLQIRGSIKERFGQQGNWEFKISSIQLLSELRDKLAKSITVLLPLHELSEGFMNGLRDIVQRNSNGNGNCNCQLKFQILDQEDEVSLEMPAKGLRISPSNDFIEAITQLNGVRYKLN